MLKKLILICLLTLNLSACIPAAFVAGAAAGGTVVYDKRSLATIRADQIIKYRAEQKLKSDPEIRKQTHISVVAYHHIVLLIGQAPTPELRARAYQLVETVPNVKRVYNQITISAPSSYPSRANDSWLTTKVKSAMLAAKGLRSGQIKVVTENSVVYLMGIVTRKQADLATDVARRVGGVQKVVKVFQYIK